MIRVIICGAGQVGFQIARHLASEGEDVTVIDHSAELISKTTELLDVRGVVGHASHPEVLKQAGAIDADILIAATFTDEINMVACHMAHALFQVPTRIARVRSQEYLRAGYQEAFVGRNMPIDVIISPEIEVARVVMRRLGSPTAFDSAHFLENGVRVIGARATETALGAHTQFRQLPELFPNTPMKIFAYVRDNRLNAANDDDQFFPGDEVYLATAEANADRALELIGQQADKVGRVVVIVGGGNIGVRVARELEMIGARPKLIEKDRRRAEHAAEALERTIVLHGDGLSREILMEAGVDEATATVTLTDDDKVNVLSCALAKAMGSRRGLALTNDPGFAPLVGPLQIDAFFNPRAVTVSTILRHVRHGPIRAIHTIRDGAGEIVEADVLNTAKISGARLRDLDLPPSARICAVLSKGAVILPHDEIVFRDQDRLVMFALRRDVPDLYQIFRVSHMF